MKKLLFTFILALLATVSAWAAETGDKFKIGDLWYAIISSTEKTVMVDWDVLLSEENYASLSGTVTVPATVTYEGKTYRVVEIGYSAFAQNKRITQVNIPGSVTSIGKYAFNQCKGLTKMTIPDNVTSIGEGAFKSCAGLTKMSIPDNVTSIGSGAFSYCTGLTEVTLPKNITKLSRSLFRDCYALRGITIPNSVTTIEGQAFYLAFNMEEVTIGKGVTSIGDEAFRGLSKITKMNVLPEVPPAAGADAFLGVGRDITVEVPFSSFAAYKAADPWKEFTNMQPYVTNGFVADNLVYKIREWNVSVRLDGYVTEPKGLLDIPEIVTDKGATYSVTEINDESFAYCEELTELIIPSTVTVIGSHAFHYNRKFTQITVRATEPPFIGEGAFANTERSIPVFVPATSLEAYQAADGWKEFTNLQAKDMSIIIVNDLKYRITDETAREVELIGYKDGVPIPTELPATVLYSGKEYSVTRIGNRAFAECFWISSFILPNSVKSIGEEAFSYCWELSEITIPNSVETIEKAAFAYNFMSKITIGSGVKSIGDEAFADNDSFVEMTVLAAVPPTVGTDAFRGTKRDIPVHVPGASFDAYKAADVWKDFNLWDMDLITFIANGLKYRFTDKDKKNVELIGYETAPPDVLKIPATVTNDGTTCSVTAIGKEAFVGCKGILGVTIPASVTSIGAGAFEECEKIMILTIPASVTAIGEKAFAGSGLMRVTIPAGVTSIGAGAFATPSITQINVESGNTSYCSEDGVLFNKEKTMLMQYPAGKLETSYVVPGTVTRIEDVAFLDCQFLYKVTLPGSLTSIGTQAFVGCTYLEEMIVLAAVPPIAEEDAFDEVSRDIPVSVPAASLEAYKAAEVWKEFTNLAIRFTADNLVYQVTDVENKYVEVIGYDTNPTGVLDIPKTVSHDGTTYSVTAIGVKAFLGSGLTGVTIPSSVTAIGDGAFADSGLTGVTIPAGVTSIGDAAFATLPITQINVESGNTSYCSEDGVLFNKEKTMLMQYPAGKLETSYVVPGTVTGIWTGAFYGCQHLNKVTLPGSLTSIGTWAFSGPIEEMIVLAAVPPTAEEDAFDEVSLDIPVYVPAASLEAYKAAAVWKEFTNLQAIGSTGLQTPSMPESISIQGGMLHNPQQLPVIIYDLTGRLVYSGNATTVELPAGIYVVSCNGTSRKVMF